MKQEVCQAMLKLTRRSDQVGSLLCVGLDADIGKLPNNFLKSEQPQFDFNKWIIEQTHQYVVAYKPNIAFYEARGNQGIVELKLTLEYLQQHHPKIVTICDAKRADIGSTNQGYVSAYFDWFGFDAVTINPYLGREAVQPFLDRKDKISIVLCRTSNSGAAEFQDLLLGTSQQPLWQIVAQQVATDWNKNGNCMLVVGGTYPSEMAQIRQQVGTMPFLVPGIGEQGGDLRAVLQAGLTLNRDGLVINASRSIIFAQNPGFAAQQLFDQIKAEIKLIS